MPTDTDNGRTTDRSDTAVIDAGVLRRERELGARWRPDWHNNRRTDPPAPMRSASSKLGLATISLSVEEIDAVLDRLDGTNGCADPVLCDAVAILAGARARARKLADVAPAAWGVR